jgi:3',5'-cyclic AMP phosphodiesterase CpdA
MRTIAHISDLHFGKHNKKAEEALLADLKALKPSLIAISGDLTQRALRAQFKHAREYLQRLPAPFLVVPGNHDIPFFDVTRRMLLPLHRYKNYITHELSPIYTDDELAIIGINSASAVTIEGGRISSKQLAWAAGVFSAVPPHCFRIVVTHHPFLKPPGVHRFRRVIRPAKKALETFAHCGVDLLLCGHFHRTHAEDVSKHHASIARPIIHVQAGTAICSKVHMNCDNSFNFITLSGDTMIVETRSWNGLKFEATEHDEFERVDGRWRRKHG